LFAYLPFGRMSLFLTPNDSTLDVWCWNLVKCIFNNLLF
jgi:hypothetical protein